MKGSESMVCLVIHRFTCGYSIPGAVPPMIVSQQVRMCCGSGTDVTRAQMASGQQADAAAFGGGRTRNVMAAILKV